MQQHMHNRYGNFHLDFMNGSRFNLPKMLTPPKGKSPWEAMTAGSTGGWAAPLQSWGPALTTAMGALAPYTGGLSLLGSAAMGAAGMAGGKTGYRGSDYGSANWGSTLGGTALGFGEGMLGSGIGGAITSATGGMPVGAASTYTLGQTAANTGTYGAGFGGGLLGSATSGFGTGVSTGLSSLGTSTGVSNLLKPFAGTSTGATGGGGGMLGAGTKGGGAASGLDLTNALMNPMTLLGLGTMAISQMPTIPTPPSIGDVASKWLTSDAITKAGKLAQTIGEETYLGDFDVDKETMAFIDVSGKEINKAYKIRREQLDQMGQASNSTWLNSGERLEMHRRLNEEEQLETDKMRSQWLLSAKQTHATNQYNYVMDAIKIDNATKQDLLYADLADVMWRYNIDRDSVLSFRTLARDAGLYLLTGNAGG